MGSVKVDLGAPDTDDVYAWQKRNFGEGVVQNYALVLAEEAGEVCRAVLKREQGIRGSSEEWTEKLRKELGDLVITAHALAGFEGWDLERIVASRWREVSARDWVTDPAGHGMAEDG